MAYDLPKRTPGMSCPPPLVSASLLAADLAVLGEEACLALRAGADWLHLDIMDGHFVNNFTSGPCVVAAVASALRRKGLTSMCDCHLYVTNPQALVEELQRAGANVFTFHLEALGGGQRDAEGGWPRDDCVVDLARRVRASGMAAGLALVPATPAEAVEPYIAAGDIDLVLLLSVDPGFGGQAFQAGVLPKAAYLRKRFPDLNIQMDGGIGPGTTVAAAAAAGVNVVVAGSAIFGRAHEHKTEETMRQAIAAMRGSLAAAGQPAAAGPAEPAAPNGRQAGQDRVY